MPVNRKITTELAQKLTDDQTITIFENLQEAKDWFFTASAQKLSADYCLKVQWALVQDENGNNTKLKKTEEWGLDGSAQVYNNKKIELIDANNWMSNIFYHDTTDNHLF